MIKFSLRSHISLAAAVCVLFFMPLVAIAIVPAWKIVPDKSTIYFTAIQNHAPVSGQFKTFTGNINFYPEKLDTSQASVIVDMNSVTTSYEQVASTLKTTEWFDVKNFPQAIFKSTIFTKAGDHTYQVKGLLTLRDKTLPVTLDIMLEEYSPTRMIVQGTATIKRTAFGIGQGEWAKTDEIADDVKIEFTLTAVK